MTKNVWDYDPKTENVHVALSLAGCHKMARRHRWEIKLAEPSSDSVICVFHGPQVDLTDDRFDSTRFLEDQTEDQNND